MILLCFGCNSDAIKWCGTRFRFNTMDWSKKNGTSIIEWPANTEVITGKRSHFHRSMSSKSPFDRPLSALKFVQAAHRSQHLSPSKKKKLPHRIADTQAGSGVSPAFFVSVVRMATLVWSVASSWQCPSGFGHFLVPDGLSSAFLKRDHFEDNTHTHTQTNVCSPFARSSALSVTCALIRLSHEAHSKHFSFMVGSCRLSIGSRYSSISNHTQHVLRLFAHVTVAEPSRRPCHFRNEDVNRPFAAIVLLLHFISFHSNGATDAFKSKPILTANHQFTLSAFPLLRHHIPIFLPSFHTNLILHRCTLSLCV